MLLSLSIIIFAGLMLGYVSNRIRLPAIVGMLVAGIVLGPHGLNVLDQSILAISSDLRKIALIIILAKAGLSLDIGDLKRIGRPAVLLCFVPASFEILVFLLFAPKLLGVSLVEAGILGAVMGAVSPAIVVPRLSYLIEEHWGTKKGIPQMILAGASADDVYNIVIFTMLIGMEKGSNISLLNFLKVPESIILGALLGAMIGLVLSWYFKTFHIRDSLKVTIIMAIGMALYYLEGILTGVDEILLLLAQHGFHIGKLRTRKDGDENFHRNLFSGFPVNDVQSVSGKVHKHPVPCLVFQVGDRCGLNLVGLEDPVELTAHVAVREFLLVLLEDHQFRRPLSSQHFCILGQFGLKLLVAVRLRDRRPRIRFLVEKAEQLRFVHGQDIFDGLSAEIECVDVLPHGVP